MILGVDFDNTIVAYDSLFHRVARERGLIPANLAVNKTAIRDHLRATGREDIWTEMQGEVYGARLGEADAYPGALAFFRACRQGGLSVRIVSHKTRYPYRGERYDLHAAARRWLSQHGFFSPDGAGLDEEDVYFELTKAEKLARIAACGCTHFIDDLPELLADPAFPAGVHRFLFDSQDQHLDVHGIRRVTQWREINPETLDEKEWLAAARRIADDRGAPLWDLPQPLHGGANNRVFRLGFTVLAKRYFRHRSDTRDRFAAERVFYDYCTAIAVNQVPRVLGWDERERLGIFSFIEGASPGAAESSHIEAALRFFSDLNRGRGLAEAQALPIASEACFRIDRHLATVQRRVDALAMLPSEDLLDAEAETFIHQTLVRAWGVVEEAIHTDFGASDLVRELEGDERCISPSDFGFHNSILTPTGDLVFIDFEYAGWDDPAKMVADFFCQPDVQVPMGCFEQVVTAVIASLQLADGPAFHRRCSALLPAYRIKWACILLNEFTLAGRERREFSLGIAGAAARRKRQLARAGQMVGKAMSLA